MAGICLHCARATSPIPGAEGVGLCLRCEGIWVDPEAGRITFVRRGESGIEIGETAHLEPEFRERYALQRIIGGGGMGIVFAAIQLSTGRSVAIKFMRGLGNPTDRERFVREARAISRIRHPNIIQIYDAGLLARHPYMVLELATGESLRSILPPGIPLEVPRALALAVPCLEALQACHRAGIIHRDIKPDNILLTSAGEPRLTDFGLVVNPDRDPTLTSEDEVVGTLAYLAPELIRHGTVSPSADIYAMGMVLHEMLTGRHPFQDTPPGQLLTAHLSIQVSTLRTRTPSVPPGLDALVRRCLAKHPEDRPASAGDVARELRALDAAGEGPLPPGLTGSKTRLLPMRDPEPAGGAPVGDPASIVRMAPLAGPRLVGAGVAAGLILGLIVILSLTPWRRTNLIAPVTASLESPPRLDRPRRLGTGALVEPQTTFVTFSRDGSRLISAGLGRRRVSVWDPATGELLGRLGRTRHMVLAAAVDHAARWVGIVNSQGELWRHAVPVSGGAPDPGVLLATFAETPLERAAVAFDRQGKLVALWPATGHVRAYREGGPTRLPPIPVEIGREDEIPKLDPDRLRMAHVGPGGTLRFHDLATGRELMELRRAVGTVVRWVWEPDRERVGVLVFADAPRLSLDVLDLLGGKQRSIPTSIGALFPVRGMSTDGSGTVVIPGECLDDRTLVELVDLDQGRKLPHLYVPGLARAVAQDRVHHRAAMGFRRGRIRILDDRIREDPRITRQEIGHEDLILALAVSPDGRTLVAGDGTPAILRWNLEGHESSAARLSRAFGAMELQFSRDGTWLAVRTQESKIGLIRLTGGTGSPAWMSGNFWGMTFLEPRARPDDPEPPVLAAIRRNGTLTHIRLGTGGIKVERTLGPIPVAGESVDYDIDPPAVSSPVQDVPGARETACLVIRSGFGTVPAPGSSAKDPAVWESTLVRVPRNGAPVITPLPGGTVPLGLITGGGRPRVAGRLRAPDSGSVRSALLDPSGTGTDPWIPRWLPDIPGTITTMEGSPDGKLLALGTQEGAVALLDIENPTAWRVLANTGAWVLRIRFHPDGLHLVAGDREGGLWILPLGHSRAPDQAALASGQAARPR